MIYFILLVSQVFATEVIDTENFLEMLNGSQAFEAAWTCGEKEYIYSLPGATNVNCNPNLCTSTTRPSTDKSLFAVENCTTDQLDLYSEQGLEFHVTKEDYRAGSNTWVVTFLKNSHQFFNSEPLRAELSFFPFPTMAEIIRNGKKETIMAQRLFVDFYFSENSMAFSLSLLVYPDGRGLDQILALYDNDDVIFKRKGVFHADLP